MSITASHLRELAALGLSGESLFRAVEIFEEASARTDADMRPSDEAMSRRKEADKLRKRAARAAAKVGADNPQMSAADSADKEVGQSVAKGFPSPSPSFFSPTPPHITPPAPSPSKTSVSAGALESEFGQFYAIYPHKVARAAGWKAWPGARRKASFETLMAELRKYIAKTDDRPWCNPATWLNGERWKDQPARVQRMAQAPPRRKGFLTVARELAEEFNCDADQQQQPEFSEGGSDFFVPSRQ